MSQQLQTGSTAWAKERCAAWNWNYNPAEIAKELIDEGIESGSPAMQRLKGEFLMFFPSESARQWWEFIEQAVEVFGD